ncbi:MAG: hypothetical protein E6Q88_07685 [Lysobacteraceae bacterium]|nr:MAG: hypothetical protein E6Q88_07685 [Xanthomonadaceae bacterium]
MRTRGTAIFFGLFCLITLGACSSGPVRRVSEPTISIQQLAVGADGGWSVDLRLQNFSSVPMRFERISLALSADGENAGRLEAAPALTVAPESVDIVTLTLRPSSEARIVVANALADRRSLGYSLEGETEAAAEDRKTKEYRIKRESALSPVPGLPGVMR